MGEEVRPPELAIWPHNEYGWSTINPAWLTFSNLVVPEEGLLFLNLSNCERELKDVRW